MATTSRFALRYPVAADANDPPTHLLNLATDLDNKMTIYLSGTLAARPAAGTRQRIYYATDTKDVSYDDGTAWRSITGNPTVGCARYSATGTPASGTSYAVIAYNTTTFNRGGTPTAATKIVVPTAGYWRVHAHQRWNVGGGGAGNVSLQIRKGPNSDTAGTVMAASQCSAEITGTFDNDVTCEVSSIVQFAAGDDFAIWHASATGGSLYGSSYESFVEYSMVTAT